MKLEGREKIEVRNCLLQASTMQSVTAFSSFTVLIVVTCGANEGPGVNAYGRERRETFHARTYSLLQATLECAMCSCMLKS